MKTINVNKDTCIGCGACVAIDDEHFNFDGDGKSDVISNENLESANLTNAVESCPVGAISIVESDKKCTCNDDCTCGCQDGKECTCDGSCNCNDDETCTCGDECHCDGCNGCH